MDELLGELLSDRYWMLDIIGRGVTGTVVFRAEDVRTGSQVTVKIINPDLIRGADSFERLKNEAHKASQIGRPRTANFIEGKKSDKGFFFVVYDYLKGETLTQLLEKQVVIPCGRVFSIMLPICDILQKAHDEGIIHRDIKPENILIGKNENSAEIIRLLDFGMSHAWEASGGQVDQMPEGGLLQPYYMSPQQLMNAESVDGRTDLYSLGVVMYRAVVGRVPFEGETFNEIKTRILTGKAQEQQVINSEIPEEAGRLIMRAFHRLPEGRFQTARELAYELRKFPGVSEPESPAELADGQEISAVELTDVVDSSVSGGPGSGSTEAVEMPEDWQNIVEEMTESLYSSEDTAERLKVGKDLALVYENIFPDMEKARKVYGILMMIDDHDRGVLDGLDRICTRSGDWHALMEVLEKKIEHEVKLTDKADLLARYGDVFIEKLNDHERAVRAYRRVVYDMKLPNLQALRGLEKIYKQEKMWEDYVEVLNKFIPLSEPNDRIDIYEEIAITWAERLKNKPRAREAAGRLLKIQPGNEVALRLQEEELSRADKEEAEEETTAEIDFRKVNPAAVIQNYLNRYEREKDAVKRSRLLVKAARIYEENMEDEASAYVLYQKAYLENYENPEVLAEIARVTEKSGKWNELIDVAKEKIAQLGDRTASVPLYLHVAKWSIEKLNQMQDARALYTRVLQIDPDNAVAHATLADMIKAAGKWESYQSYLRMQASKTKNRETKGALLAKLGKSYKNELGQIELALETFRKALTHDPLNEVALDALEEIYVVNELYDDLADIIQRKAERSEAEGNRERMKEQLFYLAKIYETILLEPLSAIKAYRKVVENDERDMTALRGLESLYKEMGHTRDIADVLELQYNAVTAEEEKIELLKKIAEFYARDFVKPELAAEKYEQILEEDPANEEVLDALTGIYRGLKEWEKTVKTIDRHVAAASGKEKKISLLTSAARILRKELKNSEKTSVFLLRILSMDELHAEALKMLAELHEEMGRYSEAFEALEKLVERTGNTGEKTNIFFRMGLLLSRRMGKKEEAIDKLKEVISIVPNHLEALGALRTIYFDMQKWDLAFETIEEEQKHTTASQQKSSLLYAQGRILSDYMDQDAQAVEYFKRALECYPENEETARPLAEYYIGREDWERAESLLDLIVQKSSEISDDEMIPFYIKLGNVSSIVGNYEKAIEAFRKAYEIEDENVEVMKGLAQAYYGMGRWSDAYKYFHMIVFKHSDKTSPRERTDIYFYIGSCKLKMNEPRKGIQLLETIIESDPRHQPTLEALIEHFEKKKNFDKVIQFKQLIADTLGGEEKYNLLVEIGDIWQERLNISAKAAAAYRAALACKPDDRKLLHKLATLHSNLKQWNSAIEILKYITDLEEDPHRKSRYYHNIAVIYQAEMKNWDAAVEYLNKALDADPDNLKEFEAIGKILTPLRDWENLEANYLRMLERIAGQGKKLLEINLLHNLGEIYRTRMKDYEAAAGVFKMTSDLDPGNILMHEILVELYRLIPDRWEDAAGEHQFLIRKNPDKVDSYKALRSIFYEKEQFDKAWCVCGVLHVLAQANEEERDFYQHYKGGEYKIPQQALDRDVWINHLLCPGEDTLLGDIFTVITPVIARTKAHPIKNYDLKRKHRKDPDSGKEPVTWIFGRVGSILNIPLPEIYVSEKYKTGLKYIVSEPAASVLGQDLLSGRFSDQELVFLITKHLTYYMGGHYARVIEPSAAGLTTWFQAAMKVVDPDYGTDEKPANQVEAAAGLLKTEMFPDQMTRLVNAVKAFVDSTSEPDVARWTSSIELSASRAGLLLCNDLKLAIRMLKTQNTGISDATLKEKVTELKIFSVSNDFFSLRKRLGLNIKG